MNHLPLPDHCAGHQMDVPHRNLVSYDRQGFAGFPQRLGYTVADILAMLKEEDKLPMVESILQEWFYFGTLHLFSEVSEVEIDLDRFINIDKHGKRSVVSYHWHEYFTAISAKETPFTQEGHGQLERHLNYVADGLGAVVQRFDRWFHHLDPAIIFSIFILVETLYDTLRLLSGRETKIQVPLMSPSPGLYFQKIMQENGWCLASIQSVLHKNTSLAYFASLLSTSNGKEHMECTPDKCFKVQKQVEHVTCKHAELECPGKTVCDEVIADPSDLVAILDRGSFPAIILNRVDGKVKVKVVDARDHEYVAISHVCKKHRKLSISRLRNTYKNAAKVLILDHQLLQVSSTNICEAVCHLSCSDWMSRLWTLQEGLLPEFDSLFIQYRDGPVSARSLCGDGSPEPMPHIVESRLRDLLSSMFLDRGEFAALRDKEQLGSRSDKRMVTLMRNLQRRRTTKQEDEPICIATLMDIDLTKFEGMPSMEDIYRVLYRVPQTLIFAGGPRLKTPGFRWAPSTFLEQSITAFSIPRETLSTQGLVTGKYFDFMALSISLLEPVTVRDKSAYMIEFPGGQKDVFFLPNFEDIPGLQEVSVEQAAIVMGEQARFSQAAVLVEVTDNSRYGRSMVGRYRLPGYVVQMDRTTPTHFRGTRFETIRGQYPLTMNWYVD